jgi:sensor c-di-GMP phosphodiesterase-like protein
MPGRLSFALTNLCALTVVLVLPWLAWQESQRQAYDAASELTLGYARDVLHRSDETVAQAQRAISSLVQAKQAPCSPSELVLMRQLDLTSTYLQAVGRVRDGAIECSSMGGPALLLGEQTFRSARGVNVYLHVPLESAGSSPLVAIELDGFAALFHRDPPLDTSTGDNTVALGVLHIDRPMDSLPELARGKVKRAWMSRLGPHQEMSFTDATHMVALTRSQRFRTVAVAAIPIARLHERTRSIARRLVTAGALVGLLAAGAILLLGQRNRSIAYALGVALRRNEFFVQYQPIVDLSSGRWVGVEALLRWRRAGELIGPDVFIPVAEQSGIITRITERVFRLVAEDTGAFLAAHPDFHVAINLSPADLQSHAVLGLIDGFLATCQARPGNLMIEITERSVLDLVMARPVINAIRARGCAVAIDDFGTGYSSLSHLDTLSLDFLKIDRSFVETIGTRAPTNQVVGHIIAMANTLGLRLIAEGVEHPAQAEILKERQVQFAQGWLFGRPAAFEIIAATVEAQPAPASPDTGPHPAGIGA